MKQNGFSLFKKEVSAFMNQTDDNDSVI